LLAASRSPAPGSRIRRRSWTVETNKHQHVIDNGKPGFGIGDDFTISAGLSTPDGATRLGHSQELCTVIHAEDLAL
jgi:hypothetical protein